MKKLLLLMLVVFTGLFSNTETYASTDFRDLSTKHWAYQDIKKMADLGLVKGDEKGNFKADSSIKRSEFVAILTRILDLESVDTSYSKNHWASGVINAAAEHGIIDKTEYVNGFEPNKDITRREMSKMIALAFAQKEEYRSLLNSFKELYYMDFPFIDAKEIKKADIPYVALAFGTGIIGGDTNAAFNLNDKATRAQATAMLHRFLNNKDKTHESFLALKELKEVAETGTNATSISNLVKNQESYKTGIVINTPNLTATLKRVYVMPLKSTKSIYENKFLWKKENMPKHYFNVDGFVVGVAEVEFKKSGSMFHLVTQNLFLSPSANAFYYNDPSVKFKFLFPGMKKNPQFTNGQKEEIVFYCSYSPEEIGIDFQANNSDFYPILFNPNNRFKEVEVSK